MIELKNILLYLFNASMLGVFSFVWIIILLDAENFGFIYEWFNNWMKKNKITKVLFKPLFHCIHCNAGQLSLWFYLVYYGLDNYNPFYHIGFITLSILGAHILNKNYG